MRPEGRVSIRRAMKQDLPGLVLVWQAAFAELVKPQTLLKRIEDMRQSVLLVALYNGTPVGFLDLVQAAKPGQFRVDYVATHPIDAPKGAGQALMLAAEEDADAMGGTHITLAVRRANHRARTFYEKLGYVSIEDRPAGSTYRKDIK